MYERLVATTYNVLMHYSILQEHTIQKQSCRAELVHAYKFAFNLLHSYKILQDTFSRAGHIWLLSTKNNIYFKFAP